MKLLSIPILLVGLAAGRVLQLPAAALDASVGEDIPEQRKDANVHFNQSFTNESVPVHLFAHRPKFTAKQREDI